MEKSAESPATDAVSSTLEKRLSQIEGKIDRVAEKYGLLSQAISALQRDLARAIPVMQKLDHLQEIKAQRKRDQEATTRYLTQWTYSRELPRILEKRRKNGESIPYHPGEVLSQKLGNPKYDEQSYSSMQKLAAQMGIRHSELRKFMNRNMRVSLKLATNLAKAVGETPEYWLDLQKVHDAWWSKNPHLRIAPELRLK